MTPSNSTTAGSGSPAARGIYVGELGTLDVRRLLDADTPAVLAPPDYLLYVQQSTLFAYSSQLDGVFELFEKPLDRAEPWLLLRTGQAKQITDWRHDGRYLLYRSVTVTPRVDMDVWAIAFDGDGTPIAIANTRWRADGRELFYLTLEGQLVVVPIASTDSGRSLRPGVPVPLFQTRLGATQGIALHSYAVAPDGQRFLLDTMVEQQPATISVILNWQRPGG
jgi:hypothetical protein